MKDNKENFNSELNDDALEEVAGGGKGDKWTPEQLKFLKNYNEKYADGLPTSEVTSRYSPKQFLKLMESNSGYDMIKKGLGL